MKDTLMQNCRNLYMLSTIACQLTDCLTDAEIAVLASDLATLGCMLSSNLAHRVSACAPAVSETLETIPHPDPII